MNTPITRADCLRCREAQGKERTAWRREMKRMGVTLDRILVIVQRLLDERTEGEGE